MLGAELVQAPALFPWTHSSKGSRVRVLVLDGGALFYSREGATDRTLLLPLTPTDYRLEGNHWFRIRVDLDESGLGRAVEGLYADGRVDRTERE